MKYSIKSISGFLRKYLLLFTLLMIVIAIPLGYANGKWVAENKSLISNLVILLAISTIYPSMIQLKTENMLKMFRKWKLIAISIVYVFIFSPLMAYALGPTIGNQELGVGFVTANVVPASSASLGYVLIAGGSIELATALAVISVIIAVPFIPFFLGLYSSQVSVSIPIAPILTSVIYILVLPMIAGQLTRYPLVKLRGAEHINVKIHPYLSTATMMGMLALIFVLVLKVGTLMVQKPFLVGAVIGYQSLIIVSLLIISVFVSRAMHASYEDHQAVAFISVSKNQSVAAAIAILALTPIGALAPAIIPMIQPVLIIIYIHLDGYVRRLFRVDTAKEMKAGVAETVIK
ncbi:MAG: arsenic resistance protein [Nitrososphaerota archaeon]|nr:arsenic resistance protein [Nitrososphaerota archaeon]MDG7039494.1 arsenic resistance protein [Nitrososphaerota archaeon]MDG7042817.1 arsenic resistance protein [Nitrososphaerota archaeon]MDG7045638.1 arsenic resistance protein [Nitrososphaerota archaeon]